MSDTITKVAVAGVRIFVLFSHTIIFSSSSSPES